MLSFVLGTEFAEYIADEDLMLADGVRGLQTVSVGDICDAAFVSRY
jgi:hypothetical protein